VDKVNTILFDIDGTMLDTRQSIFEGMAAGLSAVGHKIPGEKALFKHVGKGIEHLIFKLTGTHEYTPKIIEEMRNFQYSNMHLVKPFPYVIEVINTLHKKGYKLGAVTNAREHGSRKRLEHVRLLEFFDVVVAIDNVTDPKPHPAPVLKALELLNSKPEEAIMVGDSHFDIESGNRAGTKTVRVTYGFHIDQMDNPKPDYFIDDIRKLLKLLEK
jgi:pyrophosphatase PpaX